MKTSANLTMVNICGHRVLYFHHVGDEPHVYGSEYIQAQRFRTLLKSMQDAGLRFISLKEAVQAKNPPKGTLRLCSDDGLVSNYEEAFPILQELKISLTLFVLGKCIDNRALAWNHALAFARRNATEEFLQDIMPVISDHFDIKEGASWAQSMFGVSQQHKDVLISWLWEYLPFPSHEEILSLFPPFLSVKQLKQMHEMGVDIALHSHSHPDFSRLNYAQIKAEVLANIDALEAHDITWQPWLAFPYGKACSQRQMQRLQKECGIRKFLGIRSRWQDNKSDALLWQRSSLEVANFDIWKDLYLKPVYRAIKDVLK